MQQVTSVFHAGATAGQDDFVCSTLDGEDLCVPCGLARLGAQATGTGPRRRRLVRGDCLYRQGDAFEAIYAVRAGSLKQVVHGAEGSEQVTGFHIDGDILGLDGVARDRHECSAVALEDADVLVLPYGDPSWWTGPAARQPLAITRLLGRQLVRDQQRAQVLARRSAEARLAAFLLDVSQRMRARGYSGTEFHLRLSREEIGSYLGLQLETVSRVFTRLQQQRLLRADGKHVQRLDPEGLAAAHGLAPA